MEQVMIYVTGIISLMVGIFILSKLTIVQYEKSENWSITLFYVSALFSGYGTSFLTNKGFIFWNIVLLFAVFMVINLIFWGIVTKFYIKNMNKKLQKLFKQFTKQGKNNYIMLIRYTLNSGTSDSSNDFAFSYFGTQPILVDYKNTLAFSKDLNKKLNLLAYVDNLSKFKLSSYIEKEGVGIVSDYTYLHRDMDANNHFYKLTIAFIRKDLIKYNDENMLYDGSGLVTVTTQCYIKYLHEIVQNAPIVKQLELDDVLTEFSQDTLLEKIKETIALSQQMKIQGKVIELLSLYNTYVKMPKTEIELSSNIINVRKKFNSHFENLYIILKELSQTVPTEKQIHEISSVIDNLIELLTISIRNVDKDKSVQIGLDMKVLNDSIKLDKEILKN